MRRINLDLSTKYLMRTAYLILAHKGPRQLVRLIKRLRTQNRAFVVHIDKKSEGPDWNQSRRELENTGVLFAERVSCSWADFSLVRATLNCIETLHSNGTRYDFVTLLSGQDYPIKPNAHIDQYLSANRSKCLMYFHRFPYPEWKWHGYHRLPTWRVPAFGKPRRIVPPQLASKFHRKVPLGFHPCGGSQWWSLPGEAVEYVHGFVRANPQFVDYYTLSLFPDEMFFHTILGNSQFQVQPGDHHLHYLKWSNDDASPATLGHEDFEPLRRSQRCFARKFDEAAAPTVLDRIDHELLESGTIAGAAAAT